MLEQLDQEGQLSEGHGRALLLAEDHGARRASLAAPIEEGWSVRTTEDRARRCNTPAEPSPPPRTRISASIHPDQEQAAREIGDALAIALGAEVTVRPRRDGSYTAELSLASRDDALALAERLAAERA